MNNEWSYAIPISTLIDLVESRPGITTPDIAEYFKCSITYARWAVREVQCLEFYDGNHIRMREGDKR